MSDTKKNQRSVTVRTLLGGGFKAYIDGKPIAEFSRWEALALAELLVSGTARESGVSNLVLGYEREIARIRAAGG